MKGCRPLTEMEVETVIKKLSAGKHGKRNVALFLLGTKAGFRITEILSLRVGDVYRNGNIVERVTVERRNMKKKQAGRTVFLHPEARKALLKLIQSRGDVPPDEYIFKSQKGSGHIDRTQAYRILRNAYDAIGMTGKLGTHSMRKTFANNIHSKLGGDIFKTQRALGQKNITSTICYLSFREEEIEQAISNL